MRALLPAVALVCALPLPRPVVAAEPPRAEPLATPGDAYFVEGVVQSAFRIRTSGQTLTLVLSRTGIYASKADAELRSARLYATLFTEQPDAGGAQQLWRIQDFVEDCPVDVTAAFADPPVQVSDADADGVPEIWVAYRTACRGDVSPSTLKLIGYEGTQKYALRGRSRVQLGESSEGGDSEADAALAGQPKLLAQAGSFWSQVRDERF